MKNVLLKMGFELKEKEDFIGGVLKISEYTKDDIKIKSTKSPSNNEIWEIKKGKNLIFVQIPEKDVLNKLNAVQEKRYLRYNKTYINVKTNYFETTEVQENHTLEINED